MPQGFEYGCMQRCSQVGGAVLLVLELERVAWGWVHGAPAAVERCCTRAMRAQICPAPLLPYLRSRSKGRGVERWSKVAELKK